MLKQLVIVPLFLLGMVGYTQAQTGLKPKVDTWELYTSAYTFEQGKRFEWDWEYEKAIWVYLNLITTKERKIIVERVKNLKYKVGSLPEFINITFEMYAKYDPEILRTVDGETYMDPETFKKKRAWADQLILAVSQ